VFHSVANWLDERLNLREGFKELLDEPLPEGVGWTHVFGSISLFLFIPTLSGDDYFYAIGSCKFFHGIAEC